MAAALRGGGSDYNRFRHLGDADLVLFQKGTRRDRERLSRAMGGYWASFARDGVPSSASAPAWPPYARDGGTFIRLDADNDGGIEVVSSADDLDALVADMMNDPRIDDAERCLIVKEMGEWMFARGIHAQLRAGTGCG